MRYLVISVLLGVIITGCSQNKNAMETYVIEVTTFKYKKSVTADAFWSEDARIEEQYTSQQPGFISRESGYSENLNEVIVVVRWKTKEDADASMAKFMKDTSVKTFADMIDESSMKMARYAAK